MEVLQTTDYDMFKFLDTINRPIKSTHVSRMKQSVTQHGCIRPVVVAELTFITGTTQTYVLDGQHLLTGLRGLRHSIPYVIMQVEENYSALIKAIATLNSTAKRWALSDFVHAWKNVSQEYVRLEQYHLRYSMSYVAVSMIALNIDKRSTVAPMIKNGNFRVTNANFRTLVEAAYDLLEVDGLGGVVTIPERFVGGLLRYYNDVDEYDHERIKTNVRNNVDLIRAAATNTIDEVLRERIFV